MESTCREQCVVFSFLSRETATCSSDSIKVTSSFAPGGGRHSFGSVSLGAVKHLPPRKKL